MSDCRTCGIGTSMYRSQCSECEIVALQNELDSQSSLLREKEQEIEILNSALRPLPLPGCGHPGQYAYTKDGGKHIVCLICQVERRDSLLREAREALEKIANENIGTDPCTKEKMIYVAKKCLEKI